MEPMMPLSFSSLDLFDSCALPADVAVQFLSDTTATAYTYNWQLCRSVAQSLVTSHIPRKTALRPGLLSAFPPPTALCPDGDCSPMQSLA